MSLIVRSLDSLSVPGSHSKVTSRAAVHVQCWLMHRLIAEAGRWKEMRECRPRSRRIQTAGRQSPGDRHRGRSRGPGRRDRLPLRQHFYRCTPGNSKTCSIAAKRNVQIQTQRGLPLRRAIQGGGDMRHLLRRPCRKWRIVGNKIAADLGLFIAEGREFHHTPQAVLTTIIAGNGRKVAFKNAQDFAKIRFANGTRIKGRGPLFGGEGGQGVNLIGGYANVAQSARKPGRDQKCPEPRQARWCASGSMSA